MRLQPRRLLPRSQGRRDYTALITGALGALAVLAAAGIGSYVTSESNRSLQEDQSTAAARGIARVLSTQFSGAEARLEAALEEGRLIVPDVVTAVSISLDDQQLLASNLSLDDWAQVADTLLGLRAETQLTGPVTRDQDVLEARAGFRVPLSDRMRNFEKPLLQDLRTSIKALQPLSEG